MVVTVTSTVWRNVKINIIQIPELKALSILLRNLLQVIGIAAIQGLKTTRMLLQNPLEMVRKIEVAGVEAAAQGMKTTRMFSVQHQKVPRLIVVPEQRWLILSQTRVPMGSRVFRALDGACWGAFLDLWGVFQTLRGIMAAQFWDKQVYIYVCMYVYMYLFLCVHLLDNSEYYGSEIVGQTRI
jgi:hypothetical protein